MYAIFCFLALQWGTYGCEPATAWQFAKVDNYASFVVDVPDGYELHVDGAKAVGHTFRTPSLAAGNYRYTLSLVRGNDTVVSKVISFQPGQQLKVNFAAELAEVSEKKKPAVPYNFGVDVDKLQIDGTKITINGGEPITYEQATKIVGVPKFPDHSKCLRLTVIGSEKQLAEARKVVDSATGQDERLVCKYCLPDSWTLKDNKSGQPLGFKTTGNPSCYLQKPTGEVLVYTEGLEQLREMVTHLRQKNPTFEPNNVPSFGGVAIGTDQFKFAAVGAIAALLLAAWGKRK